MKKRSMMRFIAMILSLTGGCQWAVTVCAHEFEVDGLYYNKVAPPEEITNARKCVELTYNDSKHANGEGSYSGAVVIPESITYNEENYLVVGIGAEAFRFSQNITGIEYPGAIYYIGESAFEGCKNVFLEPIQLFELDSVAYTSMPSTVRRVGDRAFAQSGLTSIYANKSGSRDAIPTLYGYGAFEGCENLKLASIHSHSIPKECFMNCVNLESITMAEVSYIDMKAFSGCSSLKNISWGNDLEIISERAFENCTGMESLWLHCNLRFIKSYAFAGCKGLNHVNFSGYSDNGQLAWSDLAISEPNTIFDDCPNIEEVNFGRRVVLNDYTGTTLCDPFIGLSLKSVRFSDFCLESAFNGTNYPELKSISLHTAIPPIIAGVADNQFNTVRLYTSYDVSDSPFWSKFKLTGTTEASDVIIYEHNNVFYAYLDWGTVIVRNPYGKPYSGSIVIEEFTADDKTLTPTVIGEMAFYDCKDLHDVKLPPTIYQIDEAAFGYSGIKKIDLSNVYDISQFAFVGCEELEEVTLSSYLYQIYPSTFNGCIKLSKVNGLESVEEIEEEAFYECKALKSIDLSAYSIGRNAFAHAGLENVNFTCSEVNLQEGAFYNNKLENIVLPNCDIECVDYVMPPFGHNPLKSIIVNNLSTDIPLFAYTSDGSDMDIDILTVKGWISIRKETPKYPWFSNNKWLTCGQIGKIKLDLSNNYTSEEWLDESWGNNIGEIESCMAEPPLIGIFTDEQYKTIHVTVPVGSLSKYKAAPSWKEFLNITETSAAGLEETFADDTLVDIYNMQGILVKKQVRKDYVDNLPAGIYIVGGKKMIKH